MENLTKQQLILLALLVSFVSSIATGIVTVSLFDQASPTVTQTINRIVERTVETVTPTTSGDKTVVKETLVVSESDALVEAIEKASKSIVRINTSNGFAGFGVFVSDTGRIVAKVSYEAGLGYRALTNEGDESLDFVSTNSDSGLTIFQVSGSSQRKFQKAVLADIGLLKVGQTVVAMGGDNQISVGSGIVSSLVKNEEGKITRIVSGVSGAPYDTNSVLINLSGEIIGLKTGASAQEGYLSSDTIKNLITN